MITDNQLALTLKTSQGKTAVRQFLPYLQEFMQKYEINTNLRIAHFLAQVCHESAEFTQLEENLNYSAEGLAKTWPVRFAAYDKAPNTKAVEYARDPEKIANFVYGSRMGNGNESSGDGWKYHGRGLIQLTGKENYYICGKDIREDLVNRPQLLLEPKLAVHSACWFWNYKALNRLADDDEIEGITRKINGGLNGLKDRITYFKGALTALEISS